MVIVDCGDFPVLNGEEKKHLTSTWTTLYGQAKVNGTKMLARFLIANPDAKPVFKKFAGLDITEDSTLPVVNDHAERIMKGLNELVINVDNPSKQKELLEKLSMQHLEDFSVDKKYFKVLCKVILDVASELLNKPLADNVVSAWEKFLSIFILGM